MKRVAAILDSGFCSSFSSSEVKKWRRKEENNNKSPIYGQREEGRCCEANFLPGLRTER